MSVRDHVAGIEQALSYSGGTHTLEDVLSQIERGEAQLWTAEDALIITEVHNAPRLRELHVWITTGELDAVLQLFDEQVEPWAREMGCAQVAFTGRRGWARALRGRGWITDMVVGRRAL
jgi:hypothetical protein